MTKDEALKLALEALSKSDDFLFDWHENESDNEADAYSTARQLNEKAITAIKEALVQPEQEPCKTCNGTGEVETGIGMMVCDECHGTTYTTPPQRTWVGLTIQEANELWESTDSGDDWELMKRTEAKLKEKNT